MDDIILSLGSNIGDREKNLKTALYHIIQNPYISLVAVSNIYNTEPVGYVDQGPFLNLCVSIQTTLNPYELLSSLQNIERLMQRERNIRWGPRNIDIDIIFYRDEVINEENLIIPHPRYKERNFVIIPLLDICEKALIPKFKSMIRQEGGVELYRKFNLNELSEEVKRIQNSKIFL
ncbi:2-amino-4-hydroxy-6-hydroxymethyldihydropteridine diphosphokinase [Thermoclostridium stercorarium]|jgi:2-amino-4-hydroxy-6-hydroxymethyldihydropteridine diphosphokinase|uniref:2-amino-4-hydroxy-6- hydroxymethyldihydropteridine diphosphokinase n=1 Tax=Thermoclostridium stercorarium TaxID=1510 RepID=UPI00224973E6|nr:2-amino-4-hydroxy-6-hydroxymethyldihydropteridine diphosphokinase [Thermoclostridium stercorarium]UZQ86306.1 2-amino-4-hydroxy-6-hydroxymethyldihydropteridine diphosphokinase [Thermoclostridium stercorarium]